MPMQYNKSQPPIPLGWMVWGIVTKGKARQAQTAQAPASAWFPARRADRFQRQLEFAVRIARKTSCAPSVMA
jgi:hypothetical protein